MNLTMLTSKIHRATVTDASLDYEGSIGIDRALMDASGLLPYMQVDIANVTNGNRFTTYVIEHVAGSGDIVINGAAAHLASKGDVIIIMGYAQMSEAEARTHTPRKVILQGDGNNAVPAGHSAGAKHG